MLHLGCRPIRRRTVAVKRTCFHSRCVAASILRSSAERMELAGLLPASGPDTGRPPLRNKRRLRILKRAAGNTPGRTSLYKRGEVIFGEERVRPIPELNRVKSRADRIAKSL